MKLLRPADPPPTGELRERWRQVDRIFGAALERPSTEREPFVRQACGVDERLQREVLEMLAADADADSFLSRPLGRSPNLEGPGDGVPSGGSRGDRDRVSSRGDSGLRTTRALPLAAGTRVGRIRLERLLAQGGMGEVYVGFDDTLKRPVAVKSLRRDRRRGDGQARARLLREARLLSQLNHPNVCQIYDFIEGADRDFLVLEHIDGLTLRELISDGIRLEQAYDLAEQIADALTAAHGHAIIHRDLKPSNVMVTAGSPSRVKVLDFGVARMIEYVTGDSTTEARGDSPNGPVETGKGWILGTPHYMSPEQARGETATAASDLFSFGIFLRELFAAVPAGENPLDSGHGPLNELVADLITPSPQARPTAAAAAEHLRAIRRRSHGRRRAVALAALLVLLLGAGLAGGIHAWRFSTEATAAADTTVPAEIPRMDPIVVGNFVNYTGDSLLDDSLQLILRVGLEQSRRLRVLPPERLRDVLGLMDRPADTAIDRRLGLEICQREGARALVLGTIFSSGSGFRVVGEVIDPGSGTTLYTRSAAAASRDAIFSALDEIVRSIRGHLGDSMSAITASPPLEKVTTPHLEALKAYTLANQERSKYEKNPESIVALYERAIGLDPDFAMAYAKLGSWHFLAGKRELTQQYFERAMNLTGRLSDYEKTYITGWLAAARQDVDASLKAWALLASLYPNKMTGPLNLGTFHLYYGHRFREAIASYEHALALAFGDWGKNIRGQLIRCHIAAQELDKARAYLDQPSEFSDMYEVIYLLVTEQHAAALDLNRKAHVDEPIYEAKYRMMTALDQGRFRDALSESLPEREDPHREDAAWGLQLRAALLFGAGETERLGEPAAEAARILLDNMDTKHLVFAEIGPAAVQGGFVAAAGALDQARRIHRELDAKVRPAGVEYWTSFADVLAAEILLGEGRIEEAVYKLEKAVTAGDSLQAHDALARAYEAHGELTAAILENEWIVARRGIAFADRWDSLTSSNVLKWNLALYRLGRLYEKTGQNERAAAAYERLVERWRDGDRGVAWHDAKGRLDALTAGR